MKSLKALSREELKSLAPSIFNHTVGSKLTDKYVHIPTDTIGLSMDNQIKPNYIPTSSNVDYIRNETTNEDIMKHHGRKQNNNDSLDVMYDELQIPILIAIIYFMFQLPIFRKYLFSFLPSLFNKDGNPKLSGYVFNSVLFSLIFYVIKKILNYLTDI